MSSRRWRLTAWLVVLAVHTALLWVYYTPTAKALAGDERAYRARAERIAADKPVEPGLWPPLYPRVLAPAFGLGGGLWAIQALQLLLLISIALVLRDLARHMIGPGLGADLTGWLVLAYPPLVAFTHYLWPEVVHMLLLVTALWIVVTGRRSLPWMATLGVLLGLALQAKSLLLGFLPVIAIALLVHRAPVRRHALRFAVLGVALLGTVSPTLIANHSSTGRWMLATSGWFNLWVGLQDTSLRSLEDRGVHRALRVYERLGDDLATRDAILRREVRRYVQETGLPTVVVRQVRRQYFRLFDKDSYLTAQLPGGPLARVRQGYAGPVRPLTTLIRTTTYGAYAAVLLAAVLGLVVFDHRRAPWLWLAIVFVLYNLVLFSVLHAKSRFRIQILPCFFVFAGLGIQWLRDRLAEPSSVSAPPRWRWVVGAALAAVSMFLAFGAPLVD